MFLPAAILLSMSSGCGSVSGDGDKLICAMVQKCMAVISQLAYEVIKSHSLIMSKVFKGILSAKVSSQVDTKSSAEERSLLMDSEDLLKK